LANSPQRNSGAKRLQIHLDPRTDLERFLARHGVVAELDGPPANVRNADVGHSRGNRVVAIGGRELRRGGSSRAAKVAQPPRAATFHLCSVQCSV
jgi:hypothetical protein